MTRIAVTGASGFVGRHVVEELRRRSVDTVIVGRSAPAWLADSDSVRFVPHTISDADPDPSLFERMGRPDAIVHLAWGGLPNYRSLHHFERELPQQYRFLSCMVRQGLGTLVVTGTCFEYGMASGGLDESIQPRPDNPYGFAKDTLRMQLEYLRRQTPFRLTWARLFYLHGEGQAANSLLPQLRRAVETGENVFNMSGGEQLRDYLSVTEVATSLVELALRNADIGVVNVSSGVPISVRSFVEQQLLREGWTIALNRGRYPYPDYEPFAFWGIRAKLDAALQPGA